MPAVAAGQYYHCQECTKSYKAYESLCRHRRVHKKGHVFTCSVCNSHFLRKDILDRHEKIHQRALTRQEDPDQDSAGPSDRLRASRSCDHCSKKKIRCTGGMASFNKTCSQCLAGQFKCTYLRRSARTSIHLANQDIEQDDLDSIQDEAQEIGSSSLDINHDLMTSPSLMGQNVRSRGSQRPDTDQFDIANALCSFASIAADQTGTDPTYTTPSLANASVIIQGHNQSLPSMMDSWQNDSLDTQCWDWILDEFIPPSPQMMSSRASPSHFISSRQEDRTTTTTPRPIAGTAQHPDYTSNQNVDWELRQSCVFLVVHNCTTFSSHVEESTDTLMRKEGERVASIFPITHPPTIGLFDWLLDLFFQHFHPLWPTFPNGYFDRVNCPPELFLTLVIIGAHYGGEQASLFGRMAHEVLRGSLITNNLDLRSKNASSEAICQILMLNKATALYFGQRRAFFIAQQLGALSLVHARRLGLFGSLGMAYEGKAAFGVSQRSEVKKEARRRLAFGIMRLDVYLSLLLGQKPSLSWEEMRLQPLTDWSGGNTDPISSKANQQSTDVIFSDLVSLYLYGDESPPILGPVDLELVLMGLAAEVWSLGHDRYAFQRLTGKKGICITTFDVMGKQSSPSQEDKSVEMHSFDLQRPQRSSFVLLKSRWSAVLRAIRRWQFPFNSVQQTPSLSLEKSRVFSCRILYHLTLLHLFAELNELHSLTTLDNLPSENTPLLSTIRRWLNCEDCNSAVSQAISLFEAIREELQVEQSQRAHFNLLAFSE